MIDHKKKPRVALLRTSPKSVIEDYQRLMDLAGLTHALDPAVPTIVKNNISWHLMYPSANTTPWQMEAVLGYLADAGFKDVAVVENETVVTSAKKGEKHNRFLGVYKRFNARVLYNFNPADMNWTVYEPKTPMRVLDRIFPKGIRIPDYFIGKNVVHLPTVKCHIYTEMTGAMKNAFGGLLPNTRHYCHSRIHETLTDLLAIQKEIHPGIFAITDGTTAGNGPGPRTMEPVEMDAILAGSDCVAMDAVSARLMGFDPMNDVKCIRLAHEQGLGCGKIEEIEVVGEPLERFKFRFRTGNNFASSGGKLFWFGPLKFMERLMFHTPVVYAFIFASAFYHDRFWYPFIGKERVRRWLVETKWGRLFQTYPEA